MDSIQESKHWALKLQHETRIAQLKKYGAKLEASVKRMNSRMNASWTDHSIDLAYEWSIPAAKNLKIVGGTLNGLELPSDWLIFEVDAHDPARTNFIWKRRGSLLEFCLLKSSVQLLFEVTNELGEALYYQRVVF